VNKLQLIVREDCSAVYSSAAFSAGMFMRWRRVGWRDINV